MSSKYRLIALFSYYNAEVDFDLLEAILYRVRIYFVLMFTLLQDSRTFPSNQEHSGSIAIFDNDEELEMIHINSTYGTLIFFEDWVFLNGAHIPVTQAITVTTNNFM